MKSAGMMPLFFATTMSVQTFADVPLFDRLDRGAGVARALGTSSAEAEAAASLMQPPLTPQLPADMLVASAATGTASSAAKEGDAASDAGAAASSSASAGTAVASASLAGAEPFADQIRDAADPPFVPTPPAPVPVPSPLLLLVGALVPVAILHVRRRRAVSAT